LDRHQTDQKALTTAAISSQREDVTEDDALSQLREAYRGLGLEVRFYPECYAMAEGVTRMKQKAATR